jgi:hypothetical protein
LAERIKPDRALNAGICLSRLNINAERTITHTKESLSRTITVACTTRTEWYESHKPEHDLLSLHITFRVTLGPEPREVVKLRTWSRKSDTEENYAYLYHNSAAWLPRIVCSPCGHNPEHRLVGVLSALARAAGIAENTSGAPYRCTHCICKTPKNRRRSTVARQCK